MKKEYNFTFSFVKFDNKTKEDSVWNETEFITRIHKQNEDLSKNIEYNNNIIKEINEDIQNLKLFKIIQNEDIFGNKYFIGWNEDLDECIEENKELLLLRVEGFLYWISSYIIKCNLKKIFKPVNHPESKIKITYEKACDIEYEISNKIRALNKLIEKANEKTYIMQKFIEYKRLNNELNFDNCELEPMQAIEFSSYIEKDEIKVVYLKHIMRIYKIKKGHNNEQLKKKIKIIEDYIKTKNSNKIPEDSDESNNETQIILKSKNIQWLYDDTDLYYLIEKLNYSDGEKWQLLSFVKLHFISNKKKPFGRKNMTQGKNNIFSRKDKNKRISRNGELVDKIIEESTLDNKVNFPTLIDKLYDYNFFRESEKEKLEDLKKIFD